jgi:hypothetical protein
VLLGLEIPVLPREAAKVLLRILLSLLLCATAVLSRKVELSDASLPKYAVHTETQTEGIVEEVNLFPLGTKKDSTELIIKSGDDRVHVYVCPKPFQEELGNSFSNRDAIAVTSSKVKQEASDVILAREVVKGTDTLSFRDEKGNPVWDPHTGR